MILNIILASNTLSSLSLPFFHAVTQNMNPWLGPEPAPYQRYEERELQQHNILGDFFLIDRFSQRLFLTVCSDLTYCNEDEIVVPQNCLREFL